MAQQKEQGGFVTAKTPAGIDIRYYAAPRRFYELRKQSPKDTVTPETQALAEWREVISCSTALDVLSKDGLPWWGMMVGVDGFLDLWARGFIRPIVDQPGKLATFGESQWEVADREKVKALLQRFKLTTHDVRDAAGDRGDSVHKALEKWVEDRTIPVPDFYPEEERGYVRGLVAFLGDLGEIKSAPLSEVMVGSIQHGFAGRYDLEMVLHDAHLVTKVATPAWKEEGPNHHSAKGPVREKFSGRTLLDLKTPKGVYASHHLQLAGYEGARRECGYPKTEQQLVVRVGADGTYEAKKNVSTFDEFLSTLDTARAIARIEGEMKK